MKRRIPALSHIRGYSPDSSVFFSVWATRNALAFPRIWQKRNLGTRNNQSISQGAVFFSTQCDDILQHLIMLEPIEP